MYRHHQITYPDGRYYPGKVDHRSDIQALKLDRVDGLRVLDIATNDGFFAFWAEQNGAREVVAIDVGSYKDYDWGPAGYKEELTSGLIQQDKWKAFDFHHHNLGSTVIKKQMNVYDIEELGTFDVVLNYGLLYHLRNPQMALDKCRKVCTGFTVAETATPQMLNPYLPVCVEGGSFSGFGTVTDTYYPTPATLASWVSKAAFPHVFVQERIFGNRTTVVGVVDEKYLPWFSHLEACNEDYWRQVRKAANGMKGPLEK